MSTINSAIQANDVSDTVRYKWRPTQLISWSTNVLKQCSKLVNSSSLLQRMVNTIGNVSEPVGDMIIDQSYNNCVSVFIGSAIYSCSSDLSGIVAHEAYIAQSLIMSAINICMCDKHLVTLATNVTKPCVDAALFLMKQNDSIRQFINDHETATNICATIITSTINTAIGAATGTLPIIGMSILRSCLNSLWKNICGKDSSVLMRTGGGFVLNSILSGKIEKSFIKSASKTIHEYCRLILKQPNLLIASNTTENGEKRNQ